jgi:4-carboxymuconolactone decarboxylase
MSPRIPPVPASGNPPELQAVLDGLARSTGGEPQNIFRTLANHPALLRDYLRFGGRLLVQGELPDRQRELVIMRTAWLCRCAYEWGQHARLGRRAGLTDEDILAVAGGSDSDRWSPDDAQLLVATDELVEHHTVSDQSWQALAARFTDTQLLELTLLVGNYAMLAGMLNAVGVEPDAGLDTLPDSTP